MDTQKQVSQSSKDPVREALFAKGWEKRLMFSFGSYSDDPKVELEREHACLTYLMRSLSRGRVPDAQLVTDTLEGKKPIPNCGYLGCSWDAEHVH